jgi:hypothetical protein
VKSEHEVAAKKGPRFDKERHFASGPGKAANALFVLDDPDSETHAETWVEVERGHKNAASQEHRVAELAYMLGIKFGGKAANYQLRGNSNEFVRAALVACATPSHESRLVHFMLEHVFAPKADSYRFDALAILKLTKIWRRSGQATSLYDWIHDGRHPQPADK